MATKHINAQPGDFAETVLMPGDPLRAQHIAEHYLEDARRVNDVRNMWGYTGGYRGQAVLGDGLGMGIPSASIYCHELCAEYGVKRIIRVGSCGSVHPAVKLRDIVIAMGASTDSGVNRMRFRGYDFAAIASFALLRAAVRLAEKGGLRFHVGNVFSADLFYTPEPEMFDVMAQVRHRRRRDGGRRHLRDRRRVRRRGARDLHGERRHPRRRGARARPSGRRASTR